MHLISKKAQNVRVLGRNFSFRAGESIHTESSYKYSLERFAALARGSGWTPRESWTDAAGMFSVHALVASDEPPIAPRPRLISARSISHTATITRIAVVRIDSVSGDNPLANQARMPSATMPTPCES